MFVGGGEGEEALSRQAGGRDVLTNNNVLALHREMKSIPAVTLSVVHTAIKVLHFANYHGNHTSTAADTLKLFTYPSSIPTIDNLRPGTLSTLSALQSISHELRRQFSAPEVEIL